MRERLLFTKDAEGKVTFEHCKLNSCEKINDAPIDQKTLNQAVHSLHVPTGGANQLLADAASTKRPINFSVAGIEIGSDKFVIATCLDETLKETIAAAKSETEILFSNVLV